jgi:hypothetical protein
VHQPPPSSPNVLDILVSVRRDPSYPCE